MNSAGAYRHYLPAEAATRATDGAGGYVEDWSAWDDVFVQIKPLTARERVQAGKVADEVTHRVVTRWRPDFPKKVRFIHGARYLYQVGPWMNVDEADEDIEVLCVEVVPAADDEEEAS